MDWIHACIIVHNCSIEENDLAEMSDLWCTWYIGNQLPESPQYNYGCKEHSVGGQLHRCITESVLRVGRQPTGVVIYEQPHQQRRMFLQICLFFITNCVFSCESKGMM